MRTPLGILAILALVTLAGVMFVPGTGTDLARSATERPAHYVELFLGASRQKPSCARIARTGHVSFGVTSHLARRKPLRYVVSAGDHRLSRGRLHTVPGRTTTARPGLRFDPRTSSRLVVRLLGRGEHLTVHCGKASGA